MRLPRSRRRRVNHGINEVQRRGGKLSRVLWLGSQWAVTFYGIEARDGTYGIAKRRLWENEGPYGWLLHMAEKDWPDLDDFAEALRLARHLHAPVNPTTSVAR